MKNEQDNSLKISVNNQGQYKINYNDSIDNVFGSDPWKVLDQVIQWLRDQEEKHNKRKTITIHKPS